MIDSKENKSVCPSCGRLCNIMEHINTTREMSCCQYGSFRYPHHCAKSNPELEDEKIFKVMRKLKRCSCEYCVKRLTRKVSE